MDVFAKQFTTISDFKQCGEFATLLFKNDGR